MLTTLQQAKKLKELGYREKVTAYYLDGSIDFNSPINWNTNEGLSEEDEPQDDDDGYYSAPSIPEALEWFREEKGIECGVLPSYYQCRAKTSVFYIFHWFSVVQNKKIEENKSTYNYPTHSEAESALLDEVMKYAKVNS